VIDIFNTLGDAPSAPGHGMALHNVRERLRLMHDVAAQFEARRDGDVYRVQIVVPLPA
jgi:two-component system, LytTR family, sensor histidine kinase AlgZ